MPAALRRLGALGEHGLDGSPGLVQVEPVVAGHHAERHLVGLGAPLPVDPEPGPLLLGDAIPHREVGPAQRGEQVEELGGPGLLMAQARSLGAGYIVMGGYNHSRIGQYLFGGVTRTMLSACPVGLVIAH